MATRVSLGFAEVQIPELANSAEGVIAVMTGNATGQSDWSDPSSHMVM
jgi:hypothetical protein